MEATTIDQLIPDVLEEIFSHLSGSDLKNCALVCKDWDDVIGAYATTMKKLKIGFRLEPEHISVGCGWSGSREGIKIQSTDESYRKYRNVDISISDGSMMQLQSLNRFNMSQVRSLDLRFSSCANIELNKVMELLPRMPLLQMLMILFSSDCTLDTSIAPFAHFAMLKQLHVQTFFNYGSQPIFEFIKADNLTELTFYRDHYVNNEAEIDALADFIKSKKSLTKLKFTADVFIQLLQRHNFSGMNLESLKVEYGRGDDQSDILVESLISNAHSLTSLSLPSSLLTKEVRVVIFNRLRKLTKLEINGFQDSGISWMNDLSPNEISHNLSLKTFKIVHVGAIDGLKTILQGAPQLKKLSIRRGVTDAIMKEVATSAQRLVELSICFLEENLSGAQRFNELKFLKIDRIATVDSLASLLERCPKIEVFEYQFFLNPSADTNNFINILLQQKTLKHLICGFCCSTAERRIIFDKLKTNYENLRSLGLRSSDGKFILFDFPENPAEWNVEDQEAKFSAFQVANSAS